MQHRVYSTGPNRATILEERALQAGDLTDPLLARFDALWRGKCGEGWLPGVDAFDPAEIVDLLPHIMLVDIIRDGEVPRIATRLVGQHHADLFGRATAANLFRYEAENDTAPRYARGRAGAEGKATCSFERASWPPASDGWTVDQIVSVVSPRYSRPARVSSFFSWF